MVYYILYNFIIIINDILFNCQIILVKKFSENLIKKIIVTKFNKYLKINIGLEI